MTGNAESFAHDGYLILPELFSAAEVEQVVRIWRADPELAADLKENTNYEGEGIPTRLAYRPTMRDDAYSALARSQRLVTPLQELWGEPLRHYYTLNMQKDPGTGGWEYHQDYGYHYSEFLRPDFVSVMVALDEATVDNGCLRVVRGSHQLGRLEHENLGSQQIANRQRVAWALEEMDEVACEMPAGSVLYFHGNILHASNPNITTDSSRWCLIFAYVPESNRWVRDDPPQLTQINALSDEDLHAALNAYEKALA